ncbi:MAG: hypothetical protein FWC95_07800 [Defluviitaleaceae bacterium]|nr:hypothetical protein [Defluviitaleaceae bacterium]
MFHFDLLDRNEAKIKEIKCVSAKIIYNENRRIKTTAIFELTEAGFEIDFLNNRLKIWLTDNGTKYAVGIFLLTTPRRIKNGANKKLLITGYDKTRILNEDRFSSRFYVPANSKYTDVIHRLLSTAGFPLNAVPHSNLSTPDALEFAAGTKVLDAINNLLLHLNYTDIYADENGIFSAKPYIDPLERKIDIIYEDGSLFLPEFEETDNLNDIANVFTRVALNINREEITAVYVNDNPLCPFSTLRRGRRIVNFAQIPSVPNSSILEALAKRASREETIMASRLRFKTLPRPGHGSYKTVFLNVPDIGLDPAKYLQTAWSIDITPNGNIMTHEVRKVIY